MLMLMMSLFTSFAAINSSIETLDGFTWWRATQAAKVQVEPNETKSFFISKRTFFVSLYLILSLSYALCSYLSYNRLPIVLFVHFHTTVLFTILVLFVS